MHQTVKKGTFDLDNLKANTAIEAIMYLLNEFNQKGEITLTEFSDYMILLNPIAPHISEELYYEFNGKYLHEADWPTYDEEKCVESTIELPVQFNGKVKYTVMVSKDAKKEEVEKVVKGDENFKNYLQDKQIVKEIFVPGRIYNIVIK